MPNNGLGRRIRVESSLGADLEQRFNESGDIIGVTAKSQEESIWEMELGYNPMGQEIQREVRGGVQSSFQYDLAGRRIKETTSTKGRHIVDRSYQWDEIERASCRERV